MNWTPELDSDLRFELFEQLADRETPQDRLTVEEVRRVARSMSVEHGVAITPAMIRDRLEEMNPIVIRINNIINNTVGGVTWDWGKYCINICDEDAWAEYTQKNPGDAWIAGQMFPLYEVIGFINPPA